MFRNRALPAFAACSSVLAAEPVVGSNPTKYDSNGADTIQFTCTDRHPGQSYWNNLYHAYYRAGRLYRTDGAFIRKLAEGPLQAAEGVRVYVRVTRNFETEVVVHTGAARPSEENPIQKVRELVRLTGE
ncbi:MAG: hypothetical protein ACE15B_14415 [Bryobacteraceae bacterium]